MKQGTVFICVRLEQLFAAQCVNSALQGCHYSWTLLQYFLLKTKCHCSTFTLIYLLYLQTTNVKLQEYSTNDPAERCKFALILRGEQKLVFRALDVATRKEWVENVRSILRSHKLNPYTLDSAGKWVSRDGRRQAVVGQLASTQTSDSDESIISHSPRTSRQRRGMPRYNTISITAPTLIPNGGTASSVTSPPSSSDGNKVRTYV